MATYKLTKSNPIKTNLTDPEGNILYKISTQYKLPALQVVTITRADELDVVAIIHWNLMKKNTITMNGTTQNVGDVFPRTSNFNSSRLVRTGDGEMLKWNYTTKLYCMSETTGLNVATYYQKLFGESTIDIAPSAVQYSDLLVVSWLIMEKESKAEYQ